MGAIAEFAKKDGEGWTLPTRTEWMSMSVDEAHALVQKLQAAYKEGAETINQRIYDEQRSTNTYRCMVCGKKKSQTVDNHPNYVWRDDRKDPNTGLYTSRFICSQECHFRGSNRGNLTQAGVPASVHK